SEQRKLRREVQDSDGVFAEQQLIGPSQNAYIELDDFMTALSTLPAQMAQAVRLVGLEGYTYEEAARVCNCSVGTVKSRAHRGRSRLAPLLEVEEPAETRSADIVPLPPRGTLPPEASQIAAE